MRAQLMPLHPWTWERPARRANDSAWPLPSRSAVAAHASMAIVLATDAARISCRVGIDVHEGTPHSEAKEVKSGNWGLRRGIGSRNCKSKNGRPHLRRRLMARPLAFLM